MKYYLLCIGLFIFCSCSASTKKIIDMPVADIPLMTYLDYYENKNDRIWGAHGYVNAETFEVAIPVQYDAALPFVGGYAIVQEHNGKTYIINKRNEVVFRNRNLKRGTLYKMEKNDSVFVLTKSYGAYRLEAGRGILPIPTFEPQKKSFVLYNVSTGRKVLKKNTRFIDDNDPVILLIDEYLIYDDKVYVLNNKGNLDKYDMTVEDIISRTAAARNITYTEQDFHYYSEIHFDPYFSYIDILDLNVLLQHIPENMRIIGSKGDWRYNDNKPVYRISPINRNAVYPLQGNFSLYAINLEYINNNGKLTGLYNAVENKWVVNPIETNASFYETHYEDYMGLSFFPHQRIDSIRIDGNIFYNINTRKVYSFIFTEQTNFNTFPYLVYNAHYKKAHIQRHGSYYGRDESEMKIEDF